MFCVSELGKPISNLSILPKRVPGKIASLTIFDPRCEGFFNTDDFRWFGLVATFDLLL